MESGLGRERFFCPAIPVGTGEPLKQARLVALPSGKVTVLSQRSAPIDAPTVSVDIVARIFSTSGTVIASRGLGPIFETISFSSAQALERDGTIFIAANGKDGGSLDTYGVCTFNHSFELASAFFGDAFF